MQHIEEEAIQAAQDKHTHELFIEKNRSFILRCASKHTKKYITDSDDEWSVAMIAFSEAIKTYDVGKGAFLSFADLVISRRLRDYFRSEMRFSDEISINPSMFDGQNDDETEDIAMRKAVLEQTTCAEDYTMQYEIEAIGALLGEYGFSFGELASCSPKASKTKKSCADAVNHLLQTPLLFLEMHRSKVLPIKALSLASGVVPKILERHRKYIIATAEILHGDFPHLAEYLSFIKNRNE